MDSVEEAIRSFKNGKPVLIYDYDHREGETDIAIPALSVKPKDVAMMRRDGGGLICVAISYEAAERLGLPFMHEVLEAAASRMPHLSEYTRHKIAYDSRSSFSLWVNHVDTFTGVTDVDRSLTIRKIGEAVKKVLNGESFEFYREFRSPGHVAILKAAKNLIYERKGQTELSVTLAKLSGIVPAVVICEMLDEETGKALSKEKAKRYAEEKGLPFVEGREVEEYLKKLNLTLQ